MTVLEKNKFALSGSALKWIAMITMLIDHIGVILIENRYPMAATLNFADELSVLYFACRMIGRLAFPIFAFLLTVGAFHTRDIQKYALRLGAFAILSEIPFDYAFFGGIYWGYQNIFFTLFIGLLMLALIHRTENMGLRILYLALACVTAWLLKTDYDAYGIIVIFVMDLFRQNPKRFVIPAGIVLLGQVAAPLALLPIWQYDGSRGKQSKYLMYAFYPLHILALALIARYWL